MTRFAWIAVGLILGFAGGRMAAPAVADDAAYRALREFASALAVLHAYYIRPVDDAELTAAAIEGMVSGLDPHSRYATASYEPQAAIETESDFSGAGVEVAYQDGLFTVIALAHGSEAAASAIKLGDRIAAIDGVSIEGVPEDDAIARLKGAAGSKLTLTFFRKDEKNPFNVALTRAANESQGVSARREGDAGYIRIGGFGPQTLLGLEGAVSALNMRGRPRAGYVLDLRGVSGGSVEQAVGAADEFLEAGEIVSVRGRDNVRRYDAKPGDITKGARLVVLIDSGTAGAAEIVAGALQSWHRATIVGMTSAGDGAARTVLPLQIGAIGLTSGDCYTPSGRAIESGIVPDIAAAEGAWDDVPMLEAVTVAESQPGDAGHVPVMRAAPGTHYEDFQLAYALDLLSGRNSVLARMRRPVEEITLYFTIRRV